MLFINNVYPVAEEQGLYWLYFIANEFQFYVLVLTPAVYFYQRRHRRRMVLWFLALLILESIAYLFFMTWKNEFSTMLTVDEENMFDELFRYPWGPVGYYAFGIMLAIFYFEYQ